MWNKSASIAFPPWKISRFHHHFLAQPMYRITVHDFNFIITGENKTESYMVNDDEYTYIQKHCLRCRISQQISRREEAVWIHRIVEEFLLRIVGIRNQFELHMALWSSHGSMTKLARGVQPARHYSWMNRKEWKRLIATTVYRYTIFLSENPHS